MVTENRGGAGGAIGAQEVMRARADGQTLLFGTASTHALYNLVTRQPQYDARRDFVAVAALGGGPLCWMVTRAAGHARRVPGRGARAQPPMAYGSPGTGTLMHLATEILKREAGGVEISHVPYRGAAPGYERPRRGDAGDGGEHARRGAAAAPGGAGADGRGGLRRARAAGAGGADCGRGAGAPGFTAVLWHAVFAPPGIPPAVLARLSGATNAALADAGFRAQLAAAGSRRTGRARPRGRRLHRGGDRTLSPDRRGDPAGARCLRCAS
jgi:tripartite-type tricarboxylate transporter receptor subunit TctC